MQLLLGYKTIIWDLLLSMHDAPLRWSRQMPCEMTSCHLPMSVLAWARLLGASGLPDRRMHQLWVTHQRDPVAPEGVPAGGSESRFSLTISSH